MKYDYRSSKITLISDTIQDDGSTYRAAQYKDLVAASGLTVPELVKALTLFPDETGDVYGGDYRYINVGGERVPYCGGYWNDGSDSGVFYVYLGHVRGGSGGAVGFRSAYCDL